MYLLFAMTVMTGHILFAQTLVKEKDLTFAAGPSASKIINPNINKDEFKDVYNKSGFNINISYNKYFKNRIGIGIGLGVSKYSQTIYQRGLFERKDQVDRDGDSYDLLMDSDMIYTVNLTYMDVPIMLHLLLGKSEKCYGFIDIGIVNGFLISGKYTKKGSIENMGKYESNHPLVDYLLQDYAYYGYEKQTYDKEYTDIYKFYNASFRASIGIATAITDKLFLRVAPEITYGFSDITGKDDKGKEYENVFGDKSAYKASKTFSLGLNAGFTFNL